MNLLWCKKSTPNEVHKKKASLIKVLGLIHTCDFLGVNYYMNFSVNAIAKNGYITYYWTFQSTQ